MKPKTPIRSTLHQSISLQRVVHAGPSPTPCKNCLPGGSLLTSFPAMSWSCCWSWRVPSGVGNKDPCRNASHHLK